MIRWWWRRAPAILAPLAPAALALARVGGGHAFSGGHSFGGGHFSGGHSFGGHVSYGGGGGNGDLLFLLVWLLAGHPLVGIPLLLIVAGVLVASKGRGFSAGRDWSASGGLGSDGDLDDGGVVPDDLQPDAPAPVPGVRRQVAGLRSLDAHFSIVLFEDFLYALYEEVHRARAAGTIDRLAPYLADPARATLAALDQPAKVDGVIVGGLHFLSVSALPQAPKVGVKVRFETNYTEQGADGKRQTYYAVEIWDLVRARNARSRPPEQTRVFTCPCCGGPLADVVAGRCSYCGNEVTTGAFDWLVESIQILEREARAPLLFSDAGTEVAPLPTRVAPGAADRLRALQARDPAFAFEGFEARVNLVFLELQAAWSERDWKRARPFTSDRLFEDWSHWIELYQRERVRNAIERPHISRVDLADVESDAYFDSITVRLHATAIDYTINDAGKRLSGDRSHERPFWEYWTLIRGVAVQGAASAEKKCPQCGAELSINMAGQCEYCKAEVTSGAFDWVLSRIEQDEAYDG